MAREQTMNLKEFMDLCDNVNDLIQSVTPDGHFRYVNEAWLKTLGYKKNEITDLTLFDIIHPDELEHCQELFKKVMSGEDIGLINTTFVTKDGKNVSVEGNVNCNIIDSKQIYTRAILRNVTNRKKIQEDLQNSEKRFREFFNNEPNYCYMISLDGTILDINKAALDVLGYTKKQIVGKPLLTIYAPESLPKIELLFQRWRETGLLKDEEVNIITKDGKKRSVLISANAVKSSDGKILHSISVQKDITERKQNERKIAKLYKREKEFRKKLEEEMKKRLDFTRALVHELKTPLVPIIAASDLLADEVHKEQLLKMVKSIQKGASTMNSRIDKLLDIARGELGILVIEYKEVDPLKLLNRVAEEMSLMACTHELSLVLELPSSLPSVWGDDSRLEQVIINIFNNALKWTPRGGKVTLRAKEKDTNLVVEMQDTGPGIAKENRQKIFDAYYRVESGDRGLGGLGLGLALCKTIVAAHSGQIWVESVVGKGSTFGFSIPLSKS